MVGNQSVMGCWRVCINMTTILALAVSVCNRLLTYAIIMATIFAQFVM